MWHEFCHSHHHPEAQLCFCWRKSYSDLLQCWSWIELIKKKKLLNPRISCKLTRLVEHHHSDLTKFPKLWKDFLTFQCIKSSLSWRKQEKSLLILWGALCSEPSRIRTWDCNFSFHWCWKTDCYWQSRKETEHCTQACQHFIKLHWNIYVSLKLHFMKTVFFN